MAQPVRASARLQAPVPGLAAELGVDAVRVHHVVAVRAAGGGLQEGEE